MRDFSFLTRKNVDQLVRLAWLLGSLCIILGMLCLFVPLPKQANIRDIAQPSARIYVSDALLFARYSDLTSKRKTPFEFQDLAVSQVTIRLRESEIESNNESVIPVVLPPTMPDIEGLLLVGTAPGGVKPVAILQDSKTGLTKIVRINDQIRNAVVHSIFHDRITLTVDEQISELFLMSIDGSEELNRQLSGLPPQPRKTGQVVQTGSLKDSSPIAAPATSNNNAVLIGAIPLGNEEKTKLVIQNHIEKEAVNSQNTTQLAPAKQPPEENANTDSSSAEQQRSLGISGHMLSLAQQQDLNLNQTGLLVTSVRNENSTIQERDVVLTIDGKIFTTLADAKSIINSLQSDTADLQVFRDGSTIAIATNLM